MFFKTQTALSEFKKGNFVFLFEYRTCGKGKKIIKIIKMNSYSITPENQLNPEP